MQVKVVFTFSLIKHDEPQQSNFFGYQIYQKREHFLHSQYDLVVCTGTTDPWMVVQNSCTGPEETTEIDLLKNRA